MTGNSNCALVYFRAGNSSGSETAACAAPHEERTECFGVLLAFSAMLSFTAGNRHLKEIIPFCVTF